MVKSLAIVSLSLSSLLMAGFAHADWQLNNQQSRVSFVSVKKNSIAEAHHFKTISGELSAKGAFTLAIDLSSVETNIPIRNERMGEFLFETATFSKATLTADLGDQIKQLSAGQHVLSGVSAELDFHGTKKSLTIDVLASVSEKGDITVSSFTPVIINSGDFSVTEGVAKLQELAGLPSIATAVPVTFALTLNKQ